MASFHKKSVIVFALLILTSVLGGWLIHYASFWGPWAFSDSTAYIAAARSLIAGHGLGYPSPGGRLIPLTHYPPLYPWMLAAAGMAGVDMVSAARWINIILYSLLIFGVGGGAYLFTRSWFSAVSGPLILVSPVLLEVFDGAMSEPLCIFTGSMGLMASVLYIRSNQKRYLVLAALFAALASLSRYIGVAYIVTIGLAILTLSDHPLKHRLACLAAFGLISGLPLSLFLVWAYFNTRLVAGRGLAAETGIQEPLTIYTGKLMGVLTGWIPYGSRLVRLFSPDLKLWIVVGLAIGIAALALWKIHTAQGGRLLQRDGVLLLGISSLFIAIYLLTLSITFLFTTPPPDINDRILSPLQPALIVVTLGLCALCVQAWPKQVWVRLAGVLVLIVSLYYFFPGERDYAKQLHTFGEGYTSKDWHRSPGLVELRRLDLPATRPIITNDPALILFYFNVYPYELGAHYVWNPTSGQLLFGDGADEFQTVFKNKRAALVLFTPKAYGDQNKLRFQQMTQGLDLAYQGPDMSIYYYPLKR